MQRNGGNAVSDRSSHRRTHGHADNRPQLRRPQLRRADICRAKLCRADVCRAKLCRPERLGLGSAKRIGNCRERRNSPLAIRAWPPEPPAGP